MCDVVAYTGTFTKWVVGGQTRAVIIFAAAAAASYDSAACYAHSLRTCARQAGDVHGPAAGSRQVLPQRRLQGVDLRLPARRQLTRRHAGAHVQHQLNLPHLPHEQHDLDRQLPAHIALVH